MNTTAKIKKFVILGILFLLPITAYLFFSSGINHFAKLPVLTQNVLEIDQFKTEKGASKLLKDHITILCFFGNNLELSKANAFNLAHKIYKKNFQFKNNITDVYGNEWVAGNLSYHLESRPTWHEYSILQGGELDKILIAFE